VDRGESLGAGALGPDRIGDEDVVDPAGRHHLGLADCPDGDTRGSSIELHPGQGHALVGLDVRTESDAAIARSTGESLDVSCDDVEIDDDARGGEIGGQRRHGQRESRPCLCGELGGSVHRRSPLDPRDGSAMGRGLVAPWLVTAYSTAMPAYSPRARSGWISETIVAAA